MFRPMRALKAVTAAGALALAAAPAPATAAQLLVEGDNAVAIDFTLVNTPYYLFIFSLLNTAMSGFDSGETYELKIYDSNSALLGTATTAQFVTEERIPGVTPALRIGAIVDGAGIGPADVRAVLRATGGSSFEFNDTYDLFNICARSNQPSGLFHDRAICHRPGEIGRRISALNLAPPPPPPPVGGIPEPTTWALMIGGFGAVGAMLRRRRYATTAA
ncbi:MAG: PEPxxWA-CTERM sorting domain-containing protein [Phenylobacterium sp.]|jgi:hypothetical protein